eukprot:scaffold50614_cov46-Prasinocladus_malaysianus.AAC.1
MIGTVPSSMKVHTQHPDECPKIGDRHACTTFKIDGCKRVIVALGKFDAMHKGHRSLALAAAEMGGQPWLLSFSGMAE